MNETLAEMLEDIGGFIIDQRPEGSPPRDPNDKVPLKKTVYDIYVGIPAQEYWFVLFVDGLLFDGKSIGMGLKKHDRRYPQDYKNSFCLNVKTGELEWQLIELDKVLSPRTVQFMQDWVNKKKEMLIRIANEYEQNNRQTYHFMYDLIALFRSIEKHSELLLLLEEINTGLQLFHNRVQAEIYHSYKVQNISIALFPVSQSNTRKPDFRVNNVIVDVKTILISSSGNKDKFLQDFARKLRRDILDKEKEKRQLGEKGTFFIAIWSNLLSSLLYSRFNKIGSGAQFLKNIPVIINDQVIFVIPSFTAFENYYLVFDRTRVAKYMDNLSTIGYKNLIQDKDMSHAVLTSIRKGCSFGQMAEDLRVVFRFI